MIQVSSISKSYGDQTLFDGLTFNINRRERVGLVGRNGHGKTTLFRIILGEEQPDAGEVVIPKRYRIGHLDQHIRFTKATALEEACRGLPAGQDHESWRAEKILSGLGFTEEDMSKPPDRFSGGFQVRLNLAKVLVSEPDLLLLDEPTNYLDVVSIRWLSRFLNAWPSELILITHDRSFMDNVVTHTVGIHRQKAKKIEGDTGKLYDQILQEEEIHEKTRLNEEKRRAQIERFVERFRAKNSLATRVQSRIKYLEKHEKLERLERIQTLDFSFNTAPFPTKLMMRVDKLTFGYNPGPDLLSNLSFEILAHDRICVIGQNGKGKSTLLRLMAGELTPRKGQVTPHPRLRTGYFAQTNIESLSPGRDVVEEILSADGGCLPQTARNIAGAMMFEGDTALKKISVLSGGEKSRVMLGKLIVTPSHLLLLDEPTNHLDMDSCDSLLAAIDVFEGAVIMVTHNEMFLHTLATRFIVFDRGRVVVYDGSYHDFLEDIGWELDDTLRAPRSTPPTPRTPVDRKAMRQARAKILQERSRKVSPLQKVVEKLEAIIIAQESELESADAALADASARGDSEMLQKLGRKSGQLRQQIEENFARLETESRRLEQVIREFDRRVAELESE